jgi:hypothetical protein
MREDRVHYESRTYADNGEVARFCTLGLAPEAPWRCPDGCPRCERLTILTGRHGRRFAGAYATPGGGTRRTQ